ncbi:MAG: ATP-binding protein [Candidatus Melainabacteria bacterium]|nr:ATP-binding protein [Candidatus Melainabacteria bacterium]
MSEIQSNPGSQAFLSRWESGALQFSRLAALLSIVVGSLVTLGWCLHLPVLTVSMPGSVPVALTTALALISCGVSLSLLTFPTVNRWTRLGTIVFGLIPLAIAATIMMRYLRVTSFDMDAIIFRALTNGEIGEIVGRMAPHTSIGLVAGSLAMLLSQNRERMARHLAQALSVAVFGVGLAVTCGYTYGTPLLYSVGSYAPVAVPTGIAFIVLGMGMFFSRPTTGLAGIVTEEGLGGRTARLLLPVALLAPIALGYLRLFGQKYDWYAIPIDTSLIVLLMGSCFSLIVLWHCHFLSRISRREKAAIDALQRNEERTRLIIDRAYDAFIAIDREGRVIDWNLQAEKIFGWQRDEVLGKPIIDRVIPHEYKHVREGGFKQFIQPGNSKLLNKRVQFAALRKNGEQFPIELAVFPVEVSGQATFCAFIQDITDRKRIESQVELLNDQLIIARDHALEGSRLKSEFLANMSHEIRTPMNAVIGLSDLLRRTNLSRDQKRFVDLIVNSGQTLLQIIDDILVFSKIEAGRLDIENSDFDLISTVENTAELLSDKAREKKVSLTTFLSPDIPQRVRGDGQRIKQILLNLMSNAIKFTEQGRILIQAELDSITDDTVIVSFSVSDTGIGMSKEGLKILFTPFTQVDGSTTRKHGGTGLGLTISKRLVELMGGSISVKSEEGQGSTFTFTIPFAKSQAKWDKIIPVSSLENVRMLMVGLPEPETTVVESYVESWGLRSASVTYAEEALLAVSHALKENDPYMMILVDAQLRDSDPMDLVKDLREVTHVNNAKVMLLLSIDDIGQSESALQAGFDGTITRPIKQSSLFNSLLAVVEPRAVHNQLDTLELVSRAEEPPSTRFVLVAEDNIVNQEVAVLLLEELGLNAHVVSNGKMALEASQDANCQLILMDCQMPEMDGFEATMLIRQREKQTGDHIPIIAMTAHAMEGDRELCLQSGMDDYVSKPVTINRLRDVVSRWLNYRESHKKTTSQSLPALTKMQADAIKAGGMAVAKDALIGPTHPSLTTSEELEQLKQTSAEASSSPVVEVNDPGADSSSRLSKIKVTGQNVAITGSKASVDSHSAVADLKEMFSHNFDSGDHKTAKINLTAGNTAAGDIKTIGPAAESMITANDIQEMIDWHSQTSTPSFKESPAKFSGDFEKPLTTVSDSTNPKTLQSNPIVPKPSMESDANRHRHAQSADFDMSPPTYEETVESDRKMLGIRSSQMLKRIDQLSSPAEEMLDDALASVSSSDRTPALECKNGSPKASNGSVGTINMSPAQALSEVDSIMNNDENNFGRGNAPPPAESNVRRRFNSDTVNDIEISNLFDYNALESTFGSQSAKKFLNLFASMTPSLLSRLETAISGKKFQPAKDAAHELKGMCATIHIPAMVDLCRGIEESAEIADWSNAESLLSDLKRTFVAAEASIKTL